MMRRNCLWITRQDPRAADSGELIYSLGLLRALAAHAALSVTVLAHRAAAPATRGRSIPDPVATDESIQWELYGTIPLGRARSVVSALPSDAFRLGNAVQRQALRRLLQRQEWSWVVIDQAACAWALNEIPPGVPIAYIAHNDEATTRRIVAQNAPSSLLWRLALRWDAWKYGRMEDRLIRRAALVTAIAPRDAAAFAARHGGRSCLVLSPGYDGAVPSADSLVPVTVATPRRVVLVGAFEWHAKRRNLEQFLLAADEVFPDAGIELVVAGKADPGWLAGLTNGRSWLRTHANVERIDLFLQDARIGLIPEALGGGFKLKALDYVFRGLPIAAVAPALSGLPLEPSRQAIVSDDLPGLVLQILQRIDDLPFLNAAAQQALAACSRAFEWPERGVLLAQALQKGPIEG